MLVDIIIIDDGCWMLDVGYFLCKIFVGEDNAGQHNFGEKKKDFKNIMLKKMNYGAART